MKLLKTLKRIRMNILYRGARPYKDVFLPNIRTNEGLKDDDQYVRSAMDQVNFLGSYLELTSETRVLDFGCGQGRFAIGLILSGLNDLHYSGIDTDQRGIDWCKRWIHRFYPSYRFLFFPGYNERYNPDGVGQLVLPFSQQSKDLVFLNSVFSHMLIRDVAFYLSEFFRVLSKEGFVYITAFVEEGVPSMEENPENYIGESSGRLHRVRYEKNFFFDHIEKSGFRIVDYLHQKISRTGQSVLVVQKMK